MGEAHRQLTFNGTDIPSTVPLRGREEDDTSHIKRKSGRSMRRNEGSSQYRQETCTHADIRKHDKRPECFSQ